MLSSDRAGLVIHGLGGVGKSTLAAELARTVASGTVVSSTVGRLNVDALLEGVGRRLDEAAGAAGGSSASSLLRRCDVEWTLRWDGLSKVLGLVPVLVLLDNFEENITVEHGTWTVRDPELADLLSRWARSRTLEAADHVPLPLLAPPRRPPAYGRPALGPAVGCRVGQADLATSGARRPVACTARLGVPERGRSPRAPWSTSMPSCEGATPASTTWPSAWSASWPNGESRIRGPGWRRQAEASTSPWPGR